MRLLPVPALHQAFLRSSAAAATNRSLLFDLGFNGYEIPTKGERAGTWTISTDARKEAFADFAKSVTMTPEHNQRLRRRRRALEHLGAQFRERATKHRLVLGFGLPSPYGPGFLLDRMTGLPYIPGSSVKGMLRAAAGHVVGKEIGDAAQQAWWTAEVIRRIFGPVADDEEGLAQGELTCYDAFPSRSLRLKCDVLTPHFQPYYSEEDHKLPSDTHAPVPVEFLTVDVGTVFEFPLSLRTADQAQRTAGLKAIEDLLDLALKELCIGAKKSARYGWMGKASPAAALSEAKSPEEKPNGSKPARVNAERNVQVWPNCELEIHGGELVARRGKQAAFGEPSLLGGETKKRLNKKSFRAEVHVTDGLGRLRIERVLVREP